jgi:hypothetical protein
MKTLSSLALLLLLADIHTASATENAAQLEVFAGRAMVDSGNGFALVLRRQNIGAGTRIQIHSDSAALVTWQESGCAMALREAGTYTIPEQFECQAGHALHPEQAFTITPANSDGTVILAGAAEANAAPLVAGALLVSAAAGTFVYSTFFEKEDFVDPPVSAP